MKPLTLTVALGAVAVVVGALLAGATAGAQVIAQTRGERHYDRNCHELQGFAQAPVLVSFDERCRAVFSWEGPPAQQLWVYDAKTEQLYWSVAYSPLSGWDTGEYDRFNAITSPVTFGELPAGLEANGLDVSQAPRPLVDGGRYIVGLVAGCHIDPAAYPDGWYDEPISSSVGPRQAFAMPPADHAS
jgi:hypothetical protein